MRRTDSEFTAEVFRRSVEYQKRQRRIRRTVTGLCSAAACAVLAFAIFPHVTDMKNSATMTEAPISNNSPANAEQADNAAEAEAGMDDSEKEVKGEEKQEKRGAADSFGNDDVAVAVGGGGGSNSFGADGVLAVGAGSKDPELELSQTKLPYDAKKVTLTVVNHYKKKLTVKIKDIKIRQNDNGEDIYFDNPSKDKMTVDPYSKEYITLNLADFGIENRPGTYTIIFKKKEISFKILEPEQEDAEQEN